MVTTQQLLGFYDISSEDLDFVFIEVIVGNRPVDLRGNICFGTYFMLQ